VGLTQSGRVIGQYSHGLSDRGGGGDFHDTLVEVAQLK
jgi:hypothetical protein